MFDISGYFFQNKKSRLYCQIQFFSPTNVLHYLGQPFVVIFMWVF